MCGSMRVNRSLAAMLHDEDEGVRRLAHDALWSVWFRADSPKNNRELQRLMRKSASGGATADVLGAFEKLVAAAPGFAEAYNQRAIAHFRRGDFERAVADCRRALQLNPSHFGAAGGLAQCYAKQRKYYAALRAYRRALRLNPDLDGVSEAIETLERKLEEEGQK
jgi:tetratricopeptide (TPR) repeat protein